MEFMKNRCDRIANERKRRSRKKVIDTERNETAKVGEHTDLYTSRLVKLRVFSLTYLKLHNRRQRKKRVFVCVCVDEQDRLFRELQTQMYCVPIEYECYAGAERGAQLNNFIRKLCHD